MESFSDYEVAMDMPIDRFEEMIITRDIDFSCSVGCFSDGKLVGFILCGYRKIDGKKYCYDGGTGVIPSFRRKGIANDLFIKLVDLLKKDDVDIFLLEVLENNTPAIDLYRKNGFGVQRRLKCFKINKEDVLDSLPDDYAVGYDKANYVNIDEANFQPFMPSWQNQRISILNNIDNYEYCSVSFNEEVIGFGFIHKKRGDIPQLRVLKGWENKNLEQLIVSELKDRTESSVIKLVTLDESISLIKILPDIGFSDFLNLYEMTLSLD
nr:GNAT family N-acetyltransferase [Dysgonomonas alginatilytica]